MIKGLDISHYNSDPPYGKIDFKKVKADGYDFVIIKATQGTWMVDEFLEYNAKAAQDADMGTSLYHFLDPYDECGADQYDYFMENTVDLHGNLPDACDVEWQGNLTNSQLTKMVADFLSCPPHVALWLLYSNINFLDNIIGQSGTIALLADIWLGWPSETAVFPRMPKHYPQNKVKLWQKSWTQPVDGIKDPTNDMNIVMDEAWYNSYHSEVPGPYVYQINVPDNVKKFTIEVNRT